MRREGHHLIGIKVAAMPRSLERGAVAVGVVGLQKGAILGDETLDEIARGRGKDRATLGIIAVEQRLIPPALDHGGEFPAKIARILKARVDAIAAIGRMAMRRVPRDKGAAFAVIIGNRDP